MVAQLIGINDVKKYFEMGQLTVRALENINLCIEQNSFTVVMGPSGSGKSTLLYLLGGLDRPTSGHITIGDKTIDNFDENQLAVYRRLTVGFIFQSFNLIPSMTALQNIIFPMRFNRTPKRIRTEKAYKLLNQVRLQERAYHLPTELSGGEQQRVAIARALVNDPQLILADEPTGNLDTATGTSIMQLLSELHLSGRTILVVSHDPRMVNYATHKIYLLDGKNVSEGTYQAFIMGNNMVEQ
jgi:putative ABC transport system ATP-binding protein